MLCYNWFEMIHQHYFQLVTSYFTIMGKVLSKIFGKKEMRILMLGLDAAGKTSKFLIA